MSPRRSHSAGCCDKEPMESHTPLERELKAGWAGPQQPTWRYALLSGQPGPLLFTSPIAGEDMLTLVYCLVIISLRMHLL